MRSAANLNALSPVPLYTQIRELLRERILSGDYRAHVQMPSENEMVRMFGVSRITVRQALTDLQKEGLIFKIHGKGTFVSKPKATQNLQRLQGFGEAMSSEGHVAYSRVLGSRVMRAGKVVAERLALTQRDEVMEIRRVRFLDREPVSLDVTYLQASLGQRLVREDLARRDIFVILENDYGMTLGNAELRLGAVLADVDTAAALEVEEGAAILRIERLTFSADGKPVDFEILYQRGDAFQYRLRIERRHARATLET
jgi:GntR family transcriptional regulator